jgi:leucyl aminopeptidase
VYFRCAAGPSPRPCRPVSTQEITSKSSQGLRLLSLAEDLDPLWKTEGEKLELMRSGIKFVSLSSRCWGLSKLAFPKFDVTEVHEVEQNADLHKISVVAACS